MYKPERDRQYGTDKVKKATREPFPVRRSNWIADTSPPICAIHNATAVWHKNRKRESGGQWACRSCGRGKSRGLRRKWRTEHTDPLRYNLMRAFTMAKHHSKKIDRDFSIAFTDLLALWEAQEGKCAITGVVMEFLPGDGKRRPDKVTMDRIDSAKGYIAGNVWLVADWVNRAKSDLTKEQLNLLARGILTCQRLSS